MKLTKISKITESDIGRFIILKDGYLAQVATTDKAGIYDTHRKTNPTIVPIHDNIKGFFVDGIEIKPYQKGQNVIEGSKFTQNALKPKDIILTDNGRLAQVKGGPLLSITLILIDDNSIYQNSCYSFLISRNGVTRNHLMLSAQALIIDKDE